MMKVQVTLGTRRLLGKLFKSTLIFLSLMSLRVEGGVCADLFVPETGSAQHTSFLDWAKSEAFQNAGRAWTPLQDATKMELRRGQRTSELYFNNFGRNTVASFIWTGIESGNPITRDGKYRWNSLAEQGLYDPARRAKLITRLRELGIRNLRVGLSNHEIDVDNEKSWQAATDLLRDLHDGGIRVSLDLHHFGIEDRFRVVGADGKTVGEKSYYLNPAWPDYFARFARLAIEKYGGMISAVTIMNEPETVAGFNGEMWHEGFPGWSHPETNRWYIERALQIAKASVKARIEIEDVLSKKSLETRPKIIFMHTEAGVHKFYWEDFNLYRRFLISDLILGNAWYLESPLKKMLGLPVSEMRGRWHRLQAKERTILDWVIENYVVYNQNPSNGSILRESLAKHFLELKGLHRTLSNRFGVTMKTNTVFALDYYSQNENLESGKLLNPEPQYYQSQIDKGERAGLFPILTEYYNHYKMPMMIGESGTPYYHYGYDWNRQMLLESARFASQGVPFLGYVMYPGIDTWGWESALSVDRSHALENPSGLFDSELNARSYVPRLLNSLSLEMKR